MNPTVLMSTDGCPRNSRLEELTLWKIFECLVDGCAVLEHRAEFTFDNVGRASALNSVKNSIDDPGVLVHFDLKPKNSRSRPTKTKEAETEEY